LNLIISAYAKLCYFIAGMDVTIIDLRDYSIPLYNEDLEKK
jgi:hypothetical protein